MSITEKGIITLHIEPDDEAQSDYNDCPKIDLPITVTELKNLSESKRVFQDKWHVEYVSSKYPEIERRLICQPNYTAVNVLAYKLSLMDEDEIKGKRLIIGWIQLPQ